MTPTIMGAGESDAAREQRGARALFRMLADDADARRGEQGDMQGWLDEYDAAGRQRRRATLQPIWSQLSEKVIRFEDSFERSRVRFEDLARRPRPRGPEGGHGMTEFVSDRTSSNKAGVTLMNNQVGYVVADVMRGKENVDDHRAAVDDPRRRRQPDRLRLRGDRGGARAGRTSATTTSKRSCRTHYGRMVVLDDRVVLFANPEDAAEYIDFDLQVVE